MTSLATVKEECQYCNGEGKVHDNATEDYITITCPVCHGKSENDTADEPGGDDA